MTSEIYRDKVFVLNFVLLFVGHHGDRSYAYFGEAECA